MPSLRLSLNGKSSEIRAAIDANLPWLRTCFGDELGDLVQLRFEHSLAALAAHHLLGDRCRTTLPPQSLEILERLLERIEFPPGAIPAISLRQISLAGSARQWSADWLDSPAALHFAGMSGPVVALNVSLVDGMGRNSEWREVALLRKADVPALLRIMEEAFTGNRKMTVIAGEDIDIQPLRWDDLVLEETIVRLIKDDFLLFLQREAWYKQHRLPFRRGYLLHGPPGNGKSSVIRAMLSEPGISGFTIDPFFTAVDDNILAMLFAEAAQATPALIVIEDLDRCYPLNSEKHAEAKISLQQLLNHLDGVGSQNGIVVVATANNPAILDPAILRRPGRFDRVVGFQNPSTELRERYLRQMHPALAAEDLTACARATDGLSFAQLREVYILAGQLALEEDGPIDAARLTRAAYTLGETMTDADHKWKVQAGFR
jgi:hypothetical protein